MIGAAASSTDGLYVRDLGARGSRAPVGGDDPAGDPGGEARAVLAAIPEWWAARAKIAGLSGEWLDVTQAIDGLAPAPTVPVATQLMDVSGLTAAELGARYVAALSPGVRSRHGRHYTPPGLAENLWVMTRRALGQRRPGLALPGLIRDPACGGGALLLPALRQHVSALSEADPRIALAGVSGFIEGVDSDPAAAWIANIVLAAELLPLLARVPSTRRAPLPALVKVGDGLAPTSRNAAAIVMNPPYGRVRLSGQERDRWARYLYGHANLYSLFLAAGLESLEPDGVLSAVVPTSFLAGRYFSALRGEIARCAPLRDVLFVEQRDGVFAGVLQETCLAVFSRRAVRRTSVASVNGRVADVAKVSSPRGQQPWLLPRRADDAHVAAAAAKMPLTLSSAGWRVSTGPLVWNRRRVDLSPRRCGECAPVIWGADLDGGRLHRDPARDGLRWLALRPGDHATMLLEEPAILVQRTTAPEQGRRVVCVEFGRDHLAEWGGSVVVENHVNVLRPIGDEPFLSRATLAAVLATRTFDRLTRCISGSVALSAYELEALPLPEPSILRAWEGLRGDALEAAVAGCYRPSV